MRQPHSPRTAVGTKGYQETARSLVAAVLFLGLLVAFMIVPAAMAGAAVGIVGLKLCEGLSPHVVAFATRGRRTRRQRDQREPRMPSGN